MIHVVSTIALYVFSACLWSFCKKTDQRKFEKCFPFLKLRILVVRRLDTFWCYQAINQRFRLQLTRILFPWRKKKDFRFGSFVTVKRKKFHVQLITSLKIDWIVFIRIVNSFKLDAVGVFEDVSFHWNSKFVAMRKIA